MEEVIKPILELSYDLHLSDCVATCRILYCGDLQNPPSDEYPLDLSPLDDPNPVPARLQDLKTCFSHRSLLILVRKHQSLDSSHKRLSQEHVLLQSALSASATTAQTLLEVSTENETLKSDLSKEKATVSLLQKKLKDRIERRTKAELFLAQAENHTKELLSANSVLASKVTELEKSVREADFRLEKAKELTDSQGKIVTQRDDQVKKLLFKIKSQENALQELRDEVRKRESAYSVMNKRFQEQNNDSKPSPKLDQILKETKNRLRERETELEILKTMIKNQISQQKDEDFRMRKRSKPALDSPKEVKLPQIRAVSNRQFNGKFGKSRNLGDFSEGGKHAKEGFGSASPGNPRIQGFPRSFLKSKESMEIKSKSPLSFDAVLGEAGAYEDMPEIDLDMAPTQNQPENISAAIAEGQDSEV